jgi:1A family penicillin-binding protein
MDPGPPSPPETLPEPPSPPPLILHPLPGPLEGRSAPRWLSHRVVPYAAGVLALVVVLVGLAWNRCGFTGCPDVGRLSSYRPGGAPVILDRRGFPVGDLAPMEGELVGLKTLPPHVPDAFVAVEDRRFRGHGAVDFRRVVGALRENLRARRMDQGFSTITMQLARNVFPERLPGSQRTFVRKLLEVRVAQEIEQEFSKDEILEMYLNHIYFGHGARGIEAASRHYFGVPASKLGLAQAAMLAALPKAPTHYDPRRRPRQAKERRDLVITLMERQGRITPAAAQQARGEPVRVAAEPKRSRSAAPFAAWFVEEVRRELEESLGPDLYDEKLRIHTTISADAQRAAQEELVRQLEAVERGELGRFAGPSFGEPSAQDEEVTPYLQGAVVALDVASGDVLAWVGGRDYASSRFDRVRGARRQVGSAFKPFVYAAAVNAGRSMSQTLTDTPLVVKLDRRKTWAPQNFDGVFEGRVTMRDALVRSRNVPTVRLATDVGYDLVARVAEDAGLSDVTMEPSMALGTVAVSPLELAAAYTAFAGLGDAVTPRLVVKVERGNGEVLWQAERPQRRRVLSPAVAYIVTDVLREALSRGTGSAVSRAGFRAPAAGKTGTTNDGTDAWFVGYTPSVLAAVWIGFDRQRPIMERATGGRLAAPVWARMMLRLSQGRSSTLDWPRPPEVLEGRVDPASGLLLAPGCRPWDGAARRELFLSSSAPVTACPNQGEPQFFDAALEAEPPDYEEGLLTGLAAQEAAELEQLPEQEEAPPADQPRFYTPHEPKPEPSVEPEEEPVGITVPPTPTPSPPPG